MSRFWSAGTRALSPYVAGEQPKTRMVKLNTNENPWPPSPKVAEAIAAELAKDELARYPDPQGMRLKEAICRHYRDFDLTPEQVFVGNSSDEVLSVAFQAFFRQPAPLLLPEISYSFYPVWCALYGIDFETVPLRADFSVDVAAFAGRPAGGVALANPNAPTSLSLSLSEIEALAQAQPDAVVLIDEAYVDFGADSAVALLAKCPNLLVVQTFSKSRALAGLRVGFALGSAELVEGMERVKNCFNSYVLDRLAIAGAAAAIGDEAWFAQNRQKIIETRERLADDLKARGFFVLPSKTNFLFARPPAPQSAKTLAQNLRAKGVLVRHFDQPRIGDFLRITVGTPEECAALIAALD
ncbi:MAG: histidinol-phosphate transaminase [Zoogloeaceae bacterium]|jgi:histidinol-phosphate aminotransferase|nr:histidinol-phosphate transaminase [Zoogloeaceae bacterium]